MWKFIAFLCLLPIIVEYWVVIVVFGFIAFIAGAFSSNEEDKQTVHYKNNNIHSNSNNGWCKKLHNNDDEWITGVSSGYQEDEFSSYNIGDDASYDFMIIDDDSYENASNDISWISKGEEFIKSGINIKGGMLYTSKKNNRLPFVISKNSNITNSEIDISKRLLDYWPSYSECSPEAKKCYLTWLSEGRSNPKADIGYVFIFFYGLEYRYFVDIAKNPKLKDEIVDIKEEIERLLSIYGDNNSFNGYASNFIEFITYSNQDLFKLSNFDFKKYLSHHGYEMPLGLKCELGRRAYQKEALSSGLSLAWVRNDYLFKLLTPSTRCSEEFNELWMRYYDDHFKDGLFLNTKNSQVSIYYNTASRCLYYYDIKNNIKIDGVSDISRLKTPVKQLQKLINKINSELEDYSRASVDKNKTDEEKNLYLPKVIRDKKFQDVLDDLNKKISSDGYILFKFSEFLEKLSIKGNLPPKSYIKLKDFLETNGLHIVSTKKIERLNSDDFISLCYLDKSNASFEFEKKIVITLSYFMHSCNKTDESVLNLLNDNFSKNANSLYANFLVNFKNKISYSSLVKYIKDEEKGEKFLNILSNLLRNSIGLRVDIIKKLEKLADLFGVNSQDFHSLLHSNNKNSKSKVKASRKLDYNKIDKLEKETKVVADILKDVFVEEAVIEEDKSSIFEFRGNKQKFYDFLITKEEWVKDELQDMATKLSLMLDGFLEELNDASFEKYDEYLIELEANNVYVNLELLEVNDE